VTGSSSRTSRRAPTALLLHFVHRDVTPHNVLVSVDGAVKLTDFGIARVSEGDKLSKPGIVLGKLSYLPPEQLLGQSVDARADVFAGAAQALQAASTPTKSGVSKATGGIDVTGSVEYACPQGGSASLNNFALSVNGTEAGGVVAQKFTLTYVNCGLAKSEVGIAIYNGSFEVSQRIEGSSAGGTIEQSFKGRVTLSGAFDDFLEADVKQRVAASALGQGTASVKLEGTLKNSSGTYTYAEDLTLSGDLPVEVAAAK